MKSAKNQIRKISRNSGDSEFISGGALLNVKLNVGMSGEIKF